MFKKYDRAVALKIVGSPKVAGPGASTSPENLKEMHVVRLHTRPFKSDTGGVQPSHSLSSPSPPVAELNLKPCDRKPRLLELTQVKVEGGRNPEYFLHHSPPIPSLSTSQTLKASILSP